MHAFVAKLCLFWCVRANRGVQRSLGVLVVLQPQLFVLLPDEDRTARDRISLVLLANIAASGANRIVFAGGDPSLRKDLPDLAPAAKSSGLQVEIQTNAHVTSAALEAALKHADGVGLSLDGPSPEVHDGFAENGKFCSGNAATGHCKRDGHPHNRPLGRDQREPPCDPSDSDFAPTVSQHSPLVTTPVHSFG